MTDSIVLNCSLTEAGRITFGNPFNGFLVYGGAESGKTKSIGKPLLEQFIKSRFAGFIYDYNGL